MGVCRDVHMERHGERSLYLKHLRRSGDNKGVIMTKENEEPTVPEIKDRAAKKFFVHISEAELACRICEAVLDIERPEGIRAAAILDSMDEESQDTWIRAANAVMEYFKECIMDAAEPH